MISAVTFGPSAVMLTAAEYLGKLSLLENLPIAITALILVGLCYVLLMKDLKFISTLSFVLSSTIAVVLLLSSAMVLTNKPVTITPITEVPVDSLGKVVLLLFWAIIGWEIIGNYSEQVKDLKKTIPLATLIGLVVITTTYLIVSLAVQTFEYSPALSLVDILLSTFGGASVLILALLVTGLCVCTYLLIVGALARLVYSLANESHLPSVFKYKKNTNGIPVNGVLYFIAAHAIVLITSLLGILDIEAIVSIANGFFLANALIGLIAAIKKIITSPVYKIGGVILSVSLLFILGFSSIKIMVALGLVYLIAHYLDKRHTHKDLQKKSYSA